MQKHAAPSPAAEAAFARLALDLVGAGVALGQMFGARSLTLNGKALGCLYGDGLAVKLARDTSELEEALALLAAQLFDPSGQGRPFKDWVLVPLDSQGRWLPLMEAALGLARG